MDQLRNTSPHAIQVRLASMNKEYTRLTTQDNLSLFAVVAILSVVTAVIAAIVITLFGFPMLALIAIGVGIVSAPLIYLFLIKKNEYHKDLLDHSIFIETAAIIKLQGLPFILSALRTKNDLENLLELSIRNKIEGMESDLEEFKYALKDTQLPHSKRVEIEGHITSYSERLPQYKKLYDTLTQEIAKAREMLLAYQADSPEVRYLRGKIIVLENEVEMLKNSPQRTFLTRIKITHLERLISSINEILKDPTTVASNFELLVKKGTI
jgi:hypothetical protein